jgi:hypothetical protein
VLSTHIRRSYRNRIARSEFLPTDRPIRPFYKLGEITSKEGAQWHEPSPTVRWSTFDVGSRAFTLIAFARKNIVPERPSIWRSIRVWFWACWRAASRFRITTSPPQLATIGYVKQAVGLLPPPHGYWYSRMRLRHTTHREQQMMWMQRDLYRLSTSSWLSALWEVSGRRGYPHRLAERGLFTSTITIPPTLGRTPSPRRESSTSRPTTGRSPF